MAMTSGPPARRSRSRSGTPLRHGGVVHLTTATKSGETVLTRRITAPDETQRHGQVAPTTCRFVMTACDAAKNRAAAAFRSIENDRRHRIAGRRPRGRWRCHQPTREVLAGIVHEPPGQRTQGGVLRRGPGAFSGGSGCGGARPKFTSARSARLWTGMRMKTSVPDRRGSHAQEKI
jgi:hypothetical protein